MRRISADAVGIATVENLARHGGGAIVLEAGRTIMLEKEKLIARADELGIAILGRE